MNDNPSPTILDGKPRNDVAYECTMQQASAIDDEHTAMARL
jgi:hypothetical protein